MSTMYVFGVFFGGGGVKEELLGNVKHFSLSALPALPRGEADLVRFELGPPGHPPLETSLLVAFLAALPFPTRVRKTARCLSETV